MEKEANPVTASAPEWLTVRQVAERIGCSPKALYARAAAGNVPGMLKLGHSIRFKREAIESWIAENYRP